MKRKKLITAILLVIIILLYGARLTLEKEYDTRGDELYNFYIQANKLRIDNANLHQEILQHESLTTINDTARRGGFEDGTYYLLRKGR